MLNVCVVLFSRFNDEIRFDSDFWWARICFWSYDVMVALNLLGWWTHFDSVTVAWVVADDAPPVVVELAAAVDLTADLSAPPALTVLVAAADLTMPEEQRLIDGGREVSISS